MRRIPLLALSAAALGLMILFMAACTKTKTRQVQQYLLYQDIVGNAEFEEDNDYPPPDNKDNFSDDLITVTLFFGEDFDIFKKDDVYGYFITSDVNPINYAFKFVPSGRYWLSSELVYNDSCFYAQTEYFTHTDTAMTIMEMRPVFLGLNKGCWDVILTSANSKPEFVQAGKHLWLNKAVYDKFYKESEAGNQLLEP